MTMKLWLLWQHTILFKTGMCDHSSIKTDEINENMFS